MDSFSRNRDTNAKAVTISMPTARHSLSPLPIESVVSPNGWRSWPFYSMLVAYPRMPLPSCLMFLPKPYLTGYGCATLCYRDYAKTHCKKPEPGSAVIVELDEFWHFIESKKKLWIWKAYECLWHAGYRNRGRLIDWELGGREWLRHASLSSNFEEVVR